jgi:hypothetical protein
MRPALLLRHNAPKLASMIYASLRFGGVGNGIGFSFIFIPADIELPRTSSRLVGPLEVIM